MCCSENRFPPRIKSGAFFRDMRQQERPMLGMNEVDEALQRALGLTTAEVAPLLREGGDAAEMKFMECCRCLWKANGAELIEPFIDAAFDTLPARSRCVLFQRMLTIVYVAQDKELAQAAAEEEE
jgi:hypothetical protein